MHTRIKQSSVLPILFDPQICLAHLGPLPVTVHIIHSQTWPEPCALALNWSPYVGLEADLPWMRNKLNICLTEYIVCSTLFPQAGLVGEGSSQGSLHSFRLFQCFGGKYRSIGTRQVAPSFKHMMKLTGWGGMSLIISLAVNGFSKKPDCRIEAFALTECDYVFDLRLFSQPVFWVVFMWKYNHYGGLAV